MNKVKAFAQESGKVLLFGIGVCSPFFAHVLGWL